MHWAIFQEYGVFLGVFEVVEYDSVLFDYVRQPEVLVFKMADMQNWNFNTSPGTLGFNPEQNNVKLKIGIQV
jgi:hypothetical protein